MPNNNSSEEDVKSIEAYLMKIPITIDGPALILFWNDDGLETLIGLANGTADWPVPRMNITNLGAINKVSLQEDIFNHIRAVTDDRFHLPNQSSGIVFAPNDLHQFGRLIWQIGKISTDPWMEAIMIFNNNIQIASLAIIKDGKRLDNDISIWSEMRQHYVLLCELLEIVDQNLAPLILLSCANNLYFICYQLVNIFDELPHCLNYIYFWYSLLLLIGRTIVMFLCSSEIHDASQKPLEMMVGTIITYELVLLQFDTQLDPDTIKEDLRIFYNIH